MMKITIFTFYIFCICGAFGFPTTVNVDVKEDGNADEEEISGNFEGDMILSEEQEEVVNGLKNGLSGEQYRWPNKTVSYAISPKNFTTEQISYIYRAMHTIEDVSCLRFLKADENATAYVRIVGEKPGCFSTVGYHNIIQVVNLAPSRPGTGCFRTGTIMHELLHTLGFFHMQSNGDRDDHVTIVMDNVIPRYKHNFNKYNSSYASDFDVQYDYGSVLHYPEMAFSSNAKRTIIPKDPKAKIGQRARLSEGDISKLNRMYDCKNPYCPSREIF